MLLEPESILHDGLFLLCSQRLLQFFQELLLGLFFLRPLLSVWDSQEGQFVRVVKEILLDEAFKEPTFLEVFPDPL